MKPRSFDEKCLITVGIHRLNGEICCELFFGKTWIPLPIVKTSNPFYYDCKLVLYNNGNDKSVMIIGGRVGNEYKKVNEDAIDYVHHVDMFVYLVLGSIIEFTNDGR